MNSFNFTTFLTSNTDISADIIAELVSLCQIKRFKKGDFLLRQGEKCTHSFFVEKGLLRQYSIDDKGKEHIIQFAPERWFMTDRESVFFDQPSVYFIQALENTDAVEINDDFLLELSKHNPTFLEFNTRLLHNHIRHLQKRISQLLGASAEERYLDFVKIYPDILLRVPQTQVASYLGITPESLSRVRKELALKHQR